MAAKLLKKYDVSECDLQDTDSSNRGTVGGMQTHKRELHIALRYAAAGIEALTETYAYRMGGELKIAGTGPDVEMALYLAEMIRGAADRSWKDYRINSMRGTRSARNMYHQRKSYLIGFGVRMTERMKELAAQRKAERGTGTDLVVIKSEIIKNTLEEEGIHIRQPRRSRTKVDPTAMQMGRSGGDKVNLNRPLNGGQGTTRRQLAS